MSIARAGSDAGSHRRKRLEKRGDSSSAAEASADARDGFPDTGSYDPKAQTKMFRTSRLQEIVEVP